MGFSPQRVRQLHDGRRGGKRSTTVMVAGFAHRAHLQRRQRRRIFAKLPDLHVPNAGAISLPWVAAHSQSWLDVTPASGVLATGETVTVMFASTLLRTR